MGMAQDSTLTHLSIESGDQRVQSQIPNVYVPPQRTRARTTRRTTKKKKPMKPKMIAQETQAGATGRSAVVLSPYTSMPQKMTLLSRFYWILMFEPATDSLHSNSYQSPLLSPVSSIGMVWQSVSPTEMSIPLR